MSVVHIWYDRIWNLCRQSGKALSKPDFLLEFIYSSPVSNRTVDPNCRLCQLEVEDIRHVVTRCPAFHSIRTLTINQLMNLVIDNSNIDVLNSHFIEWESFRRIIICPDNIRHMVPELSTVINSVEELSRDFFYKTHTKRLFLMKQQG